MMHKRYSCQHNDVLRFAWPGVELWECTLCHTMSERDIRQGRKTCLVCDKPLDGRKRRWCGDEACLCAYLTRRSRDNWRWHCLKRDNHTCQRCGWHETPESKAAYQAAKAELYSARGLSDMRRHTLALAKSGQRQLEVHHIIPLEQGGPLTDPDNGRTLCHLCHDQEHRELAAKEGAHQ